MRRFGWAALFCYALLGVALEAAHAWKAPAYLDDPLVQMLLRLAHAHGVGLSLVCLVFSSAGLPLLAGRSDSGHAVGSWLQRATLLLPLGFGLGCLGHPEGDPGPGIVLAPVGALCLLLGLAQLALAGFERK